jgi:heme-degrading monooxygenase HmoA
MICRVWHGWTKPLNADAYERLLKEEIFEGIAGRKIDGYRGIQLLRQDQEMEIEFVTMMWFTSLEAVRAFAGDDFTRAVVPAKAQALLSRYDDRSAHYDVRADQRTGP